MKQDKVPLEEFNETWPKGEFAPCRPDGQVVTVDNDSKDAACICPIRNCIVDFTNRIIPPGIDLMGKTGKEAYKIPNKE